MGVIKVSNSKSDPQGHSRVLAMVPFCRSHTIFYLSSIATMSLSCIDPEILSLIFQNLKRSRDSEHIPSGSNISCMHSNSSVSIRKRNLKCPGSPTTIWLGQWGSFKNGSRDSDHALLEVVCHHRIGFDTVYLHVKFDDSSFSHFRDSWCVKIKVGHATLITPTLRVIGHPYAGTWHSLHACKIWPL